MFFYRIKTNNSCDMVVIVDLLLFFNFKNATTGLIIDNSGFCGGSLISRQVVLTAAHCVDSSNAQAQVILGAHSVLASEATQQVLVSSRITVHSRWSRLLLQNDVAVITINTVSLNNAIQLISLAPANAPSYAGSSAVLTGWGRTSDESNSIASQLKRVSLQIITNDVCRNSFGIIIQANHICTSGQGTVGACNGDSGGPLVVNGVQVGVVSFGNRLCESQNPSAFARVSSFRSWITEVSGV
ncbi:hypothetical protein ABEB36_005916 [Hypothenemus hampei]|uniref:Peptidase S1 domain-containing protein n=1 Tax=Hypothenemus hampei TaxID=57062 RepID=A0ABD1F2I7_HYPHA